MCGPAQKKTVQLNALRDAHRDTIFGKGLNSGDPLYRAYQALFSNEDSYAWAKTYAKEYSISDDRRRMKDYEQARTKLACTFMQEAAKKDAVLPRSIFLAFPEAAEKVSCTNIRKAKEK